MYQRMSKVIFEYILYIYLNQPSIYSDAMDFNCQTTNIYSTKMNRNEDGLINKSTYHLASIYFDIPKTHFKLLYNKHVKVAIRYNVNKEEASRSADIVIFIV